MTRVPQSMKPSSAGLQKPPASVKTCSTPFSTKARAKRAPPRNLGVVVSFMASPFIGSKIVWHQMTGADVIHVGQAQLGHGHAQFIHQGIEQAG